MCQVDEAAFDRLKVEVAQALAVDDPERGVEFAHDLSTNLTYGKADYRTISELPQIILMADCDIVIDDAVTTVDAWLIAKNAVRTYSHAAGDKFKNRTIGQNDCGAQLLVNCFVQADRVLLWRNHGVDLTTPERAQAAEIFDMRPDQTLSDYAHGLSSAQPTTVYETQLPPLY